LLCAGQAHVLRQVLARARADAQRGADSGPGPDADATGDEGVARGRGDVAGDEEVLAAAGLLGGEAAQERGGAGGKRVGGLTVYVASSRDMGNCTFYRGVKLGLGLLP
jgi:hypothetical protein